MTHKKKYSIALTALVLVSAVASVGVGGVAAASMTTQVSAQPSSQSVSAGSTVTYNIVVGNASGGVGAYSFNLSSTNPSAAKITGVQLKGNPGLRSVQYSNNNASVSVNTVGGNAGSGRTTIATVTVKGVAAGSANLKLNNVNVATQGGSSYTVSRTNSGSVSVTSSGSSSGSSSSGTATTSNPNHRAAHPNGTGKSPTESKNTRYIFPGATVYQGGHYDKLAGNLSHSTLTKTGNNGGQPLQFPIPQNQQTGTYTKNGRIGAPGVTVVQPRITSMHITNQNGKHIEGSQIPATNANQLTVNANWNYYNAENVQIRVFDSSGNNVTSEVVPHPHDRAGGSASWKLNLANQTAGSYQVQVQGVHKLDFGSATQSETIKLTNNNQVNLQLSQTSVTQGKKISYKVTGSVAGDHHIVTMQGNNLAKHITGNDLAKAFRTIGKTSATGVVLNNGTQYAAGHIPKSLNRNNVDFAYAQVQVDKHTGYAPGGIDTQYLDTTSGNVKVYPANGQHTLSQQLTRIHTGAASSKDSVTLSVNKGNIGFNNPTNSYVIGSKVELNGTAPSGIGNLAVYARDQGQYKLVDLDGHSNGQIGQKTIAVKSDGTWSQKNVVLSSGDGPGNRIFSITGTFRLGVVAAQDAKNSNGKIRRTLTVSQFNSMTSGQESLRVTPTQLSANFKTINGQVAQSDGTIDVNGSAAGSQNVLIGFVGQHGQITYTTSNVNSNSYTFSATNVPLTQGSRQLSRGVVHGFVYTIGKDNQVGDGSLPSGSATGLGSMENYLHYLQNRNGLSGKQIMQSIQSQTVNDTASDDHLAQTTFRYSSASSNINSIYTQGHQASGINKLAQGQTAVVKGTTNLKPSDNTITIELQNHNGNTLSIASTSSWKYSNGQWSVQLPIKSSLSTGNYTMKLDDGQNTNTVNVQVVNPSQVSGGTSTTTSSSTSTTMTSSSTSSTTTSTSTSSTMTSTSTSSSSSGSSTSSSSTPGFGVGVAVIALAGAALLALRRNN